MKQDLVFELPSDLGCIKETVDFVLSRCSACQEAEGKLHLNFRVSLIEALSNAMLYGNGQDPAKRVHVEISIQQASVVATITDEGGGFDPSLVPDPTIPANLERTGGRGLFLIRSLMDEVRYNAQGNSVTLILHLPAQQRTSREVSA
jgi:serine/threonine-protein kinase RsbW